MADAIAFTEPPPVPPIEPNPEDCCQSGCSPCVFDYYTEELQEYRAELKAWEARRAAALAGSEPGAA